MPAPRTLIATVLSIAALAPIAALVLDPPCAQAQPGQATGASAYPPAFLLKTLP
jgi:hypothetical protein